jgi:hypothetical protein
MVRLSEFLLEANESLEQQEYYAVAAQVVGMGLPSELLWGCFGRLGPSGYESLVIMAASPLRF